MVTSFWCSHLLRMNIVFVLFFILFSSSAHAKLPTFKNSESVPKQNSFSNSTNIGSVGVNESLSTNAFLIFDTQPTYAFQFTLEESCYAQISVSWDDAITLRADLDFIVYNEDEEDIIYSVGIRNPERSTFHFTSEELGNGIFFVKVFYYDLPSGSADFTVTIQTNSTSFCALQDDDYENNQSGTFSPKIPDGETQNLILCNDDWFYFELPKDGDGVVVELLAEDPLNPDFIIYDTEYSVIYDSEDVEEDVVALDLDPNKKYYLQIYDSHDPYRVSYNLTVTKHLKKKSQVPLIVGLVVGLGVPLFAAAISSSIFISRYYKKRLALLEEEHKRVNLETNVVAVMEELLDKYWELEYKELELGKEIGRGNFGVVYKAIWRNSTCVVKQLNITNAESQDAIVEFLKEATAVKQVKNHKNVCSIFGVCTNPHYPVCIVMEYCNGGSMKELNRSRKLPMTHENLFKIAKDISSGMSHIHKENVLHLDLAARNLLVSFEGSSFTVKVADLGLARIAETGKIYGSKQSVFPVRWSAPEVLKDIKLTKAADVWSFGITMWELLEDKLPYVKLSNPEVFNFLVNEQGTLPKPTRVEVPEEIWGIIQRCWAFDPEQRPSFDDLNKELRLINGNDFQSSSSFIKDAETEVEMKKIPSQGVQYENSIQNYVRENLSNTASQDDDNPPALEKSPTVYGNQNIVSSQS